MVQDGFVRFPRREANYKIWESVRDISYAKCKPNILHMPIKLDIELSNTCNLKCEMCYLQFKNEKKHYLGFDKIKELLDENYGLIEVRIQGISEPFLAADTLFESVKYAADRLVWTRTTTNGTLLHINENYKKIIDAGIGEFGVSIDGVSKQTYEKIRRGSDFERVCENSKLLNEYCRQNGVDKTRMWVVAQKDNMHELHLFPKFARELGFNRITVSLYVIDWGMEVMQEKNRGKALRADQAKIDEMVSEGKKYGVDVTFWDHAGKFDATNICNWPFERAFVSSDGSIVPCCVLPGPNVMNFGNVYERSFSSIWFSGAMLDFRASHCSMNIVKECLECYAK